ncbi:MAG: pyruvate kinase, partial [Acidobacteriota bacterium]
MLQIVATVGPASRGVIRELGRAGATAIRLNASHMTMDELRVTAAAVREELPDCPLVVDLQGAKMRLGEFAERRVLSGERVIFSRAEPGKSIPLPHAEIFSAVLAGDTLSCDDDRLRFRVSAAGGDRLETVSLSDGILLPRKGVNVLEHPIVLSDLTEADLHHIRMVKEIGRVSFAFSFMRDGGEAQWLRASAPGCPVIGKVERAEAVRDAHAIARRVDALWICRGDLGAQLGPAAMARWVASYDPCTDPCPVLMAGQVLQHMTHHPEPTRAEVCH